MEIFSTLYLYKNSFSPVLCCMQINPRLSFFVLPLLQTIETERTTVETTKDLTKMVAVPLMIQTELIL